MKHIEEDIKENRFRSVYLLYGEENYLKRQYKEKLKHALIKEEDTMNLAYYEGKNIDQEEIVNLADTVPFFADHRLILIENSGAFKHSAETLAAYLDHIPEFTCLVFVENEIDKRSKMYNKVKKNGRIVEFTRQKEEILTQWILGRLKREEKKITRSVMQLFLEKAGNDMENIDRELEKLFCYTLGREVITEEDVEAVCVGQITGKIFQMVDKIAEGKQKQALELYYDLLTLREPPMRILFLIGRQFQILLQVKELERQGYDRKTMASKAKVPEFALRKHLAQAKRFTKKQLKEAVTACVQAEEDVKTGNMNDKMAVELLIVRM
ncbi:MAG: DNA polymerase III subunit delta [Lachnospiraceae bacterium]|nr:DNA polymerase III subunit delta [Lachnospiraceae bacterium]